MHSLAALTLKNFDPPWFWALVIVLALAVLVLTYGRIYRRSGRRLTWTLLALRVLGVSALLIALVKPVWEQRIEQTERPRVAVVVDDSQSMSLPHPDAAGQQWTPRYAKARQWLRETEAGRALRDRFDVRLFDVTGRPLDGDELPPEASAEQTDLVRALRGAAHRMRGTHAAGVVLISDGRDTTGRQGFVALNDYPMPVVTLGYRQPEVRRARAADVAVTAASAPARTLVHNTVPIDVSLRKDGGEAREVPIHVERAGETLATRTVSLSQGATRKRTTLNYTPREPGLFTLTVRADAGADDRTRANNAKMVRLRVEAQPMRVLYIEGVLRPEAKFLRQRLERDPDIDLITFTRAANPQRAGSAGALVSGELVSADRLERIDVVLLGDFEARMLESSTYRRLRDWVAQGGGLMVLGGYHNLGPAGLGETALSEVLALRTGDGAHQLNEAFPFTLTKSGQRHPALTVTGDRVRDAKLWASLPKLQGIVATAGARTGATVLARHPRPNPEDDQQRGYPVLAVQRFDEGVNAVLTADTTWRWSRLARLSGRPDTMYVRFWSQMVRWLAQRDDPTANTALTVSTDAPSYARGRRVQIDVERNPAAAIPAGEDARTTLKVAVRRPNGERVALEPDADTADPDQWRANYFPDRGGRYRVEASLVRQAADEAKTIANQSTAFLVEGSNLEMNDPATNPATLRQIARLTGGVYHEIDQADAAQQVAGALPAAPRVRERVQRSAVWHSPALFIAFLVLMTGEWLIRRRNRLV